MHDIGIDLEGGLGNYILVVYYNGLILFYFILFFIFC
jgi:hypothetical protein